VGTDLFLKKSGGSDVIIAHNELNKETVNMIVNTLNLEAGDVIKMQADTSKYHYRCGKLCFDR
jgi:hypothetical protein